MKIMLAITSMGGFFIFADGVENRGTGAMVAGAIILILSAVASAYTDNSRSKK